MAQAFDTLDTTTRSQMACTFATLLLHDSGIEVNTANLNNVLKQAKVDVAPYWPMLFCNALDGKNVGDFLAVGSGSAPQQTGNTETGPVKAVEEVKEEVVEEEEEDMDLGDLFG